MGEEEEVGTQHLGIRGMGDINRCQVPNGSNPHIGPNGEDSLTADGFDPKHLAYDVSGVHQSSY
jgi:hypothetical protein